MKSGEELKLEYCLIFRFKDDKIISYDEWMVSLNSRRGRKERDSSMMDAFLTFGLV